MFQREESQRKLKKNNNIELIYIQHIQNLWDAAKAVLRRKFGTLNAQIMKEEKPQINGLHSHFKNLEKKRSKMSPK